MCFDFLFITLFQPYKDLKSQEICLGCRSIDKMWSNIKFQDILFYSKHPQNKKFITLDTWRRAHIEQQVLSRGPIALVGPTRIHVSLFAPPRLIQVPPYNNKTREIGVDPQTCDTCHPSPPLTPLPLVLCRPMRTMPIPCPKYLPLTSRFSNFALPKKSPIQGSRKACRHDVNFVFNIHILYLKYEI